MSKPAWQRIAAVLAACLTIDCFGPWTTACFSQDGALYGRAWPRYAIDASLRGADGVKLTDANGDGLPDVVTGWEESGQTRAYFHPGKADVTQPWPKVDLGVAPSTEDAVWVDLNGDGQVDVLSSCEGNEQTLRMHLAPTDKSRLLDPAQWTTQILPGSQGLTKWMFAIPFPDSPPASGATIPLQNIVVGSKSPRGMVGMLSKGSSDATPWHIEKLADAQWIMSLVATDVDGDGDLDIMYTDRKGPRSGVYWLENPRLVSDASQDERRPASWKKHLIGAEGLEVMFLAFETVLASSRSGSSEREQTPAADRFYVGVKPNLIFQFDQVSVNSAEGASRWETEVIEIQPTSQIGRAKGVAAGDLDADGQVELVFSCESAESPKSGVIYCRKDSAGDWQLWDVSGPEGIKYDLLELVDLDLDGDLDILTCEEREGGRGLGVIWYANPFR